MHFTTKILLFLVCLLPARSLYADEPVILIVGDSLSAGFNMDLEQARPRLLQNRLDDNRQEYRVFNSSIGGDTTQGGLARLPRLLEAQRPRFVIIELGGNDGLRGIGVDVTRRNLARMIEISQAAGATVILAGIRLPPNYGPAYIEKFEGIFPELSREYGLLLVPFLLEDIALNPERMQPDGIHPNVAAQPALLDNVWVVLGPALE